jgi:hypothetical protein
LTHIEGLAHTLQLYNKFRPIELIHGWPPPDPVSPRAKRGQTMRSAP